jgi:large subunit ribosomal protein L10
MENPRPEKVAVVSEVRAKLEASNAVVVTEYRGMTVAQIANLRRALRPTGGEYKVYKNTLVRRAADEAGMSELNSQLVGPSGVVFVSGDVAAAAKTLRDFAKANPLLVIKGGSLGGKTLSANDVQLAQIAGAFQAPMVKMAGLLQALPRNFAYGLKALIDQREAA